MTKPKQIIELEKLLGFELEETDDIDDILSWRKRQIYCLNETQAVIGLNLKECELTDISFLQDLFTLTHLNISNNQITDIDYLEKLTNLKFLDINHNRVRDIRYLKKLTNLFYLVLRSNYIVEINFLGKLTNLTHLDIGHNPIRNMHFLEQLTSLTFLNISKNRIKDYSFLSKLTNLTSLFLHDNRIINYGFLEKLTNLTELGLASNQITDISFLEKLTNLSHLNLSHNKITNYSLLEKLINLTDLKLINSEITDIRFLAKLTNLTDLDLNSNQITDISPLLSLLKKQEMKISMARYILKGKINLYNNPITTPPIDIVAQGNAAIIAYFEAEDKIPLFETKLLIVGEGGAGKTSLLRKLIDKTAALPEEAETTRGIDIHEYHFEMDTGQDFRMNIWDFGGQEIYHATHQFFLTRRSLYILLDDTRKDDKNVNDAVFNYWLQTIELFGGGSPIVIVQNEKGDRSKGLDLKSMQARFGNIKGSYPTNLLTCRGLDEVQKALHFYATQLPHVGEKLPRAWVQVREAVEVLEQQQPTISSSEYFEICTEKGITDRKVALIVSQYLHDLGVFLHFQDDDLLQKTVILQNEWATDAVYKVLDDEIVKKRWGRFNREDLERIWDAPTCKGRYADLHGDLLRLMERFEICYTLEDTKSSYIAPLLFSEIQPQYDWDETDNLIVKLKYGFMPKGIISRSIVRLNRYVKDENKAWKNGVILENEDSCAEIVHPYGSSEIRIKVIGGDNKRFLDIILEDFERLHRKYEGIEVDTLIPCNCLVCSTAAWDKKYYFEYETLKMAYANNVDKVQCQKNFKYSNLHRLLSDTLTSNRLNSFYEREKDLEAWQRHTGGGDNVGGNKIIHHHYNAPTPKEATTTDYKRQPLDDKNELKNLVTDGELEEIFEILTEKAEAAELKREIELLKADFRTQKQKNRKRTISQEEFRVALQQINESLLEIIDHW